LYGVTLVVNWTGWASEMENLINLHIERESYVVTNNLKARIVKQVGDVGLGRGVVIINT
jgi:hypothetical protein